MNRWKFLFCNLLSAAALVAPSAHAEDPADYPATTVKMIVGFAPGGSVDLMARYFAERLADRLGKSFIVENRPGAGGNIGAALVAKSKPDGYTLLVTSVVHSISPSLYPNLPYDPVKDFSPVATIGTAPNCIAVNSSTPFKSLGQLVAYAKANPGKLAFSSAGGATTMYLGMALFESMAGIKMMHVPYNGATPSLQAAVAGQVPVVSVGCGSAEPFVRSGQLRNLGVSTLKPSHLTPGVPTIAEAAGVPGYQIVNWIGVFAPAGTPPEIVAKLSKEIAAIQDQPAAREWMTQQGVDPYYLPAARFASLVRSDILTYSRLVKESGAKVQQ